MIDLADNHRSTGALPDSPPRQLPPKEPHPWVTNEKTLVNRAGLRGVDSVLAGLTAEPGALIHAVEQAEALLAER